MLAAAAASCPASARARLFEKHTLNNQMLMEAFAEVARGGTAGLAEVPAAQLEELRDDPVEKDWGEGTPARPRGTLLHRMRQLGDTRYYFIVNMVAPILVASSPCLLHQLADPLARDG